MATRKVTVVVATHNLWVTAAADPAWDEFECFLLDGSHALDERLFRRTLTTGSDGTRHVFTHHFIHVQHVQVDTTQLHTNNRNL